MSNKKLGSTFERELAEVLYEHGFWVHLLNANQAGQPADIIAVKNKTAYLIDAKVCTNGTFPLSRVEENQDMAMSLWRACGNGEGWFALKFGDEVWMIPYSTIVACKNRKSSMTVDTAEPFGEWVKRCK